MFVFWWGKQKYGYVGGLLVLFLTALSPNILAHARYVTTDAGAAFAFVFSIYFFVKYVSKPTLKNLALAGIAFGLAQLFKFSLFLLIPLYVFTLGAYYIARNYPLWKNIAKNIKSQPIDLDPRVVGYAVETGLKGDKPVISEEEQQKAIQGLQKQAQANMASQQR